MEAAAVAQVCHSFEMPFVTIRSLSDMAGEECGDLWNIWASGAHSAKVIFLGMLSKVETT